MCEELVAYGCTSESGLRYCTDEDCGKIHDDLRVVDEHIAVPVFTLYDFIAPTTESRKNCEIVWGDDYHASEVDTGNGGTYCKHCFALMITDQNGDFDEFGGEMCCYYMRHALITELSEEHAIELLKKHLDKKLI